MQVLFWRRDRDLNPGYAINVNTISSRAPSATQPSLHAVSDSFCNDDYYNSYVDKLQDLFLIFDAHLQNIFCTALRISSTRRGTINKKRGAASWEGFTDGI